MFIWSDNTIMTFFLSFFRYKVKLEPASDHGEDTVPPDTNVNSLLGARRGFYHLLDHYKQERSRFGSTNTLLRETWPRLAPGMVCAALHGLIQTGYNLNAGDDEGVCEGIAYTHYSYQPLVYDKEAPENQVTKFGKGTRSALSVLEEVRNDNEMCEKMLADAEVFRAATIERGLGTGQNRMVSMVGKQGDRLMGLVNQLHMPDFKEDPSKVLGDYLVQAALTVYHGSDRRNDFLLLHGVTGAWSLRNIMPHLSREDIIDSARIFLCCLLGTYKTQDNPELKHTVSPCDITDQTWQEIIDKALAHDFDEHIFKLVQVCHDMWLEDRASRHGDLYVASARVAVDYPIVHAPYVKVGVSWRDQFWSLHVILIQNIDCRKQDCSDSSVLGMELPQSSAEH